jgi:hypothetical protein
VPAGSGVGWMTQVPFSQRSASGVCEVFPAPNPEELPTAVHVVAFVHDTAPNSAELTPDHVGFGVDRTDHADPFHRSACVHS